jgi:hypothetical protein
MVSSSHPSYFNEIQDATIINPSRSISHSFKAEQHHGVAEKQDAIDIALDTQSSIALSKHEADKPTPQQAAGWFHWHEPDTSPEEKKLIFKLD